MKVAVLGFVFALLAVTPTAHAGLAKKHKRFAATHERMSGARRSLDDGRAGYIERDAAKLPFGSSAWWDQMLRENRLTCCN